MAERVSDALSNTGLSKSTGLDGQITGVDAQITGVYDNTCFCTVHTTTQVEPNVERITPPNPIRRRVEVGDDDSDDKDDEETNESSHAPQVEVRNDHIEEEEETEAPQLGCGRRMQTPTDH